MQYELPGVVPKFEYVFTGQSVQLPPAALNWPLGQAAGNRQGDTIADGFSGLLQAMASLDAVRYSDVRRHDAKTWPVV